MTPTQYVAFCQVQLSNSQPLLWQDEMLSVSFPRAIEKSARTLHEIRFPLS